MPHLSPPSPKSASTTARRSPSAAGSITCARAGSCCFPQFRDGSGIIQGVVPKNAVPPEVFDAIKTLTQESSVIVEGKVRADKRAPGGYELDVANVQVVQRVPEIDPLSHHAQGTRHRFPDGAPPSLGALAAAGGDSARARRDHQSRARFLRRARLHADRSADHHSGGLRRHDHAFPGRLFRRAGVPHAVGPALHRSHGDGAGQGVFLRPDISRGEIEDAPPPHRVLDGRTRSRLRQTRRRDGTGRRPHQLHREALPREAPRRSADHRPRHFEARKDRAAIPAHQLRRRGEESAGRPRQGRARNRNSSGAAISARPTKLIFPRSSTSR